MYCYRCNAALDMKKDACPKCGADVRFFKKIVSASNRKYNDALLKAESRNLTGARQDLEESLYLYKRNIVARNLLGLILYAMGESAEALKQWVISSNLANTNNPAERYIHVMRRRMAELDNANRALKMYNQALSYSKNNAHDLAIIQLKKVISIHPTMAKAYELLGLLYMQEKKYKQAEKILEKCLEVDRGSVLAICYLKELRSHETEDSPASLGSVGTDEPSPLIIPVRFRDYGSYLANALYIALGLLFGILIAWFVIVPGRVESEIGDVYRKEETYQEQISELQQQLAALQQSSENEEEPDDPTIEDPSALTEVLPTRIPEWTGWSRNQSELVNCVGLVNMSDYANCITSFLRINPTILYKDNQVHYKNLLIILAGVEEPDETSVIPFESAWLTEAKNVAEAFFADGNYEEAAQLFEALSYLYPEAVHYRYMAGQANEKLGEVKKAARFFWQCIVLYPEADVVADATSRYLSLTGNTEVPGLPEGEEKENYTKPLNMNDYYQRISDQGPV